MNKNASHARTFFLLVPVTSKCIRPSHSQNWLRLRLHANPIHYLAGFTVFISKMKRLLVLCRPVATRVSSFKSRESEDDGALVKSECCGFAHESNQKEEDLPYQPPFSFPIFAARRASERAHGRARRECGPAAANELPPTSISHRACKQTMKDVSVASHLPARVLFL